MHDSRNYVYNNLSRFFVSLSQRCCACLVCGLQLRLIFVNGNGSVCDGHRPDVREHILSVCT